MVALPKLKLWHWLVLALALIFVGDWFAQRADPRTRELNQALEAAASPQLKNYPFKFKVLRVEGETAIMASPRSFAVPAARFLARIHPGLDVKTPSNPAFIAAQEEMARLQSEASGIVQAQPGVKTIRWEVDKRWLSAHGIEVEE